MLKRIKNTQNKVFENRISGVIFCGRDSMYLKTEKIARTHENITFLSCFAKPQERTDREMTGN